MRYEWVLFDADNTLWDFNAAEASALERTLVKRDIHWSEQVLRDYRLINHEVWKDFENGVLPKSQLRTIRFERLLAQYRLDHPLEEMSYDYLTYLSQSTHMLPGAVDLLASLSGKVRMGLITNGLREVQRPRLRNTGVDQYFEFVTISDEIGVAKPDRAFFEHAYAHMDEVDRRGVLVVGDNPNADIAGALNFGFDACWLRRPGVADRQDLGETYRVRSIAEVGPLLESLGHD